MNRPLLIIFFLGAALAVAIHPAWGQRGKLTIAAASDVKFALDSVVSIFENETRVEVMVSYGSSGKLFEQISNGAPFEIFFSADLAYPELLEKKGMAMHSAEIYGTGRLVIWSKTIDPSILKTESLVDPRVNKVAIANPQHAPYGKRAVEVLHYHKLYDKVKSKLVYGENIAQASQYLYSGAADIGIIAFSLALSPPMQKQEGKYFLIPEESHAALQQAFVFLKTGMKNKALPEFYNLLKSERAKAIFKYYGFTVPGETLK